MCLPERNTDSRGRSSVPEILVRMRSLRRSLPISLPMSLTLALRRLAGLAPHGLAAVADALAAVGLWRTQVADAGCEATEQLLVGRGQHDHRALRVGRHDGREARGQLDRGRVREADREHQVLAL